MASFNSCIFMGNAGANAEVRTFDNGNKIATVRIAVTERYKDRNGQQQENTEWVSLVFNGSLADIAGQYITKGSPIFVEGKLRTRKWTDQQGGEHQSTEVMVNKLQLLGPRPQSQPAAPAPQPASPQYQQAPQPPAPQYAPQPQAPAPAPQPTYPQYAPQPQAPAPQYEPQGAPAPQQVDPNFDLPF